MTLKRLMLILGILVFLAGAGIMWLWQYAYSPEGRARVIIAQLRNDTTSLRGWMLQHHVIRPGYSVPTPDKFGWVPASDVLAADEMVRLDRQIIPFVIETLQDRDYHVRWMAIDACGKFHDPAVIQPLAKCMRDATIENFNKAPIHVYNGVELGTQCNSRDALIEIGPEAYGPLLEASKNADENVRHSFPFVMAQKWGSAAVPHLIDLLEDSQGDVRSSAAEELGKLKDQRATGALIRHLSDYYATYESVKALGEIGDREAIPSLLKMLREKGIGETFQITIAGALARMGREEGLKFLVTRLKSSQRHDRIQVAKELGTTDIRGTIELLLSLRGDSEVDVRCEAVKSLGKMHDPRAIPALKKFQGDPDTFVQMWAASFLKEFGAQYPSVSQPGKP